MSDPIIHQRRIGLALSGGSVRGIAHIGVIKALAEYGIRPEVVVGTSVGSLIGAGIAAGLSWQELKNMAEAVFWPSLLQGRKLEQFCSRYLPSCFGDLSLPFAAVATTLPSKHTVVLTNGSLATAISASCAMRVIRRSVSLNGQRLKDGGISCVLPSLECRQLGAEFIIGSDVWEFSAFLRGLGVAHTHHRAHRIYPHHYMEAVQGSDVLIQPDIPIKVYVPGCVSIDQLIAAGESATHRVLGGWIDSKSR
ncbi:MAG TPA: patatin-like phospholipase family protein [Candidatus Angelobacter sp.]